jgi:chaperone modulatory protein CbpM
MTPSLPDPAVRRPSYPLATRSVVDLDTFARRVGVHPDLLRRFVALDLVPAHRDRDGTPWFRTEHDAVVARIRRLRSGLGLSYSTIGVVLVLLDRIERAEAVSAVPG